MRYGQLSQKWKCKVVDEFSRKWVLDRLDIFFCKGTLLIITVKIYILQKLKVMKVNENIHGQLSPKWVGCLQSKVWGGMLVSWINVFLEKKLLWYVYFHWLSWHIVFAKCKFSHQLLGGYLCKRNIKSIKYPFLWKFITYQNNFSPKTH